LFCPITIDEVILVVALSISFPINIFLLPETKEPPISLPIKKFVLFVLSNPFERFIPSKLLDKDELIDPVTITDPVATITLPDCTKLTEPVNC